MKYLYQDRITCHTDRFTGQRAETNGQIRLKSAMNLPTNNHEEKEDIKIMSRVMDSRRVGRKHGR